MDSLKDAKDVVEEGGCTVWGKLPEIPYKSNKFGLGFTLEAPRVVLRARAGRQPFRINNNGVNGVEDADRNYDIDNWIFLLPAMDPTIGSLNTLYHSHLFMSKFYFLFSCFHVFGYVI